LLVTETYGSAVRLTSILTDAPLPCGEPINDSRCGDCVECVRACPGQAANGEKWQAGKPRDEFFDAKICQATARNLAKDRTGIEDTFCGICMAACPWTKRYIQRATNSPSVDLDTNI
jgi:epoxyqueuosine reductase QueG